MPVMGAARFERFFRRAASLDVDKSDLKRYDEFLDRKIHDLFVVAKATAKVTTVSMTFNSPKPQVEAPAIESRFKITGI